MVVDKELDYLFLTFAEMFFNQFVVLIDILNTEVLYHHLQDVTFLDLLFLEALIFAFLFLMKLSLLS